MLSPTLETKRLILRRYQENDLDTFYEIIHDPRLQEYISFPNLTKKEELLYLKKCIMEADTSLYEKWSIVLKEENISIGNISVNTINKKNNYCNVGYVIKYNYQGKGYATESLKTISNYLLEEGYYLVECSCNELNLASINVILKSGFIESGYIKNRRLNLDGTYSSVKYYEKCKRK